MCAQDSQVHTHNSFVQRKDHGTDSTKWRFGSSTGGSFGRACTLAFQRERERARARERESERERENERERARESEREREKKRGRC